MPSGCKFEIGKKYKPKYHGAAQGGECIFVGNDLVVLQFPNKEYALYENYYNLYEEVVEPKTVEHKFYVTSNGKIGGGIGDQQWIPRQTVRFTYDDDKILEVELVG